MADRYWVGGTGNWDATNTTNWSATSGGTGGASVPTQNDDVYLDVNSGVGTITATASICKSFYCNNQNTGRYSGTLVLGTAAFQSFYSYGNFILSPSMTLTMTQLVYLIICSGIGIWNIDFAGIAYGASYTMGLGGNLSTTINLLSDIKHDGVGTGVQFDINATLITNNYNIYMKADNGNAYVTFNLNNNSRLGSSVFTVSTNLVRVLNNSDAVWESSTILVNKTSSVVTTTIGGGGFGKIGRLRCQTDTTVTGNVTIGACTIVGPSTPTIRTVNFNADATGYPIINGNFFTESTAGNRRIFISSSTYGLGQTIAVNGTTNLVDVDFRDIYVVGKSAPISGTRIGNRGNCTGINFSIPKTVYWNLAGAQSWSANGWATTPTGTPSTDNFPLPQDTATFTNAGSITGTITLDNAIAYVPTVDMSARTTAMTLAFSNATTTCYGNWTNGSGTAFSGTLALTFSGGRTQTITSAGKTFTCPITIDTYGGTVQLADAYSAGGTSGSLTITNGTFNTQGYAVTCSAIVSNNSNIRVINLGASTVTLNGTVSKITCTTTTNLTFNAGTSNIIILPDSGGNWATVDAGSGLIFYDVSITGGNSTSTDSAISGACTFRNLTFVRTAFDAISRHTFNADITVTGTLTISTTSATRRIGLKSNTPGTPRTITAGAFSGSDCDFQDIILAGAAAGASPTRAGNCGGNSGITFPSAKTVYWNLAGTQNWYSTAWCTSTDGGTTLSSPDVNNFPLVQDTAVINNVGSAGTITIQVYNLGTFDASSRTTAVTISINSGTTVFGDWKFGTGVTSTVQSIILTFTKNGTQTITSNGVQFGCNITVNHPSGVVQLADALSLNSARTLTLTLGTFDAVSYNVTTGLFSNGSASNTLKMGSGTWTLSGTGTVWVLNAAPTLIVGTSTIVLSDTSTTARTFSGGGLYYNKLTIGGATGTSTLTINGGANFGEFASTKTVAHTILFASTAAVTIGKWSVTGTAGNVVTVGPTVAASTYPITIAGPANTGIDYLSISYCALSTTSPGEFYVGANSTNTAGNTGAIVFTATPSPRTLYWVGGTGNWSATTSWSTSSGGSSGAAIPTSLDSVIFDSASNATAYTATIDTGVTIARCAAFNMAGPASGNITWAGTVTIAFHGNVTFAATGITRSYSGALNWAGNSSYTFTTNGLQIQSTITVNGIGSTWTLGSALTTTTSLTVTYGNFNTSTSSYNINALLLSSSNSNVRGISLNGSTFTSTGSGGIINFGTITNLTFNAGTSSLNNIVGNSLTFNGGGLTFYNVIINAGQSAAGTINGANIFNNLTITGQTSLAAWQLTFTANQTINGTLTIGAGTTAAYRTFLSSDTIGTQRTLTCAAISSLTDIDFRDINFAGAITLPVTGTRLGDCKGNSNITFDAAKTVYYRQTGTSGWGTSGTGSWSLTSGGAFDATAFPLAQDTAVFPAATYPASGSIVSINDVYNIGTIDMSLRTTNTMTITAGSAFSPSVYGDWINGSGITFSLNQLNRITFAGRTTQRITTAGKTWTASLTIETPGGSVVLQDNFIFSVVTQNTNPDIKYGTFDANGYNVTLGDLGNSYAGMNSSGTNVRTINFGSGTWTVQHGGTFMTLSGSNLTIFGTATINVISTVATGWSPTGNLSGMTLNLGGSGQVSFTSDCTIGAITKSYIATATTLNFATNNIRVGSWTASGTAGKLLTITGTSASSPATLIYTGSGSIPTIDYVVPTYVKAYPTTSTWFLGSSSINAGSLGLTFPTVVSQKPLGSFMTFF